MSEFALIIGATSSLAVSNCHQLCDKGWNLVISGRDRHELEILKKDLQIRYGSKVIINESDLSFVNFSAENLVDEVIIKIGSISALFMFAGDMGSENKFDERNLKNVTNSNYTVPAAIVLKVAQHMKFRKKGSIVIISSVAGDRGRQSNFIYGSAKAALTAFCSGLRNSLSPFGVHVVTVKPGFIDTPMTYGMNSPLIYPREKAAQAIVKAMKKRKDVVYVPFIWLIIMTIINHIPETIFKRLKL